MGFLTAFVAGQFLRIQTSLAANGIWLAVHAAPWIALAVIALLDWQTAGGKARLVVAAVALVAVYLQLTGHFPSFKGS